MYIKTNKRKLENDKCQDGLISWSRIIGKFSDFRRFIYTENFLFVEEPFVIFKFKGETNPGHNRLIRKIVK